MKVLTSRWIKPRMHFQHGKWHIVLPTKYTWSWYVGNGNTMEEAWECFEHAKGIANMMNHSLKTIGDSNGYCNIDN